jgi:hypothetical protein
MTLGNAAAAHVRLIVWCLDCRHQVEPDPAEMAERYGRRDDRPRLAQAARLRPMRRPADRFRRHRRAPEQISGQHGSFIVAPRATKDTWRTHELVAKTIYEALLKQSNPEQWDIKHDTKLVGLKTCHQIDVYWKFHVAGFEHFVIVQVKKKEERVTQGDLLLFSAVLQDIPGQPKGVFVSQTGYQKGALKVASNLGIEAFELRKIDQITSHAVTMTSWSVGTLAPRKDMMAWEITIL